MGTVSGEADRRDELVERARQLAPKLAARAASDPWARRVEPDVIDELRGAELLTIGQPSANGGQELDWITYLEVNAALAEGLPVNCLALVRRQCARVAGGPLAR